MPNTLPAWLTDGAPLRCPACDGVLTYSGPRHPSLRFACPRCDASLEWRRTGETHEKAVIGLPTCSLCGAAMVERNGKFGKFWGCSNYAKTKCRGKPGPRPSLIEVVEDVALLVAEEWGGVTCLDPERVARLERWQMREERKAAMATTKQWK